jgi:hypothetical protein
MLAADGEEVILAEDAKLSAEARGKLKKSTFCGPGRSFPCPDCSHVAAARRLIGRAKVSDATKSKILACVSRKAKALGCGGEEKKKDEPETPVAQTTDAIVFPEWLSDESLRQTLTDSKTGKKVLDVLSSLDSAYQSLEDRDKYPCREAIRTLMERWSNSEYFEYLKKRLSADPNATDMLVARSEYDTLHDAVEAGEQQLGRIRDSHKSLLTANESLVREQKKTLATALVAYSVLAGEKGYEGLDADQIRAEIEIKSKKSLISLTDMMEEILSKKLPGFVPGANASYETHTDGAGEVNDNAKLDDSTASTPNAGEEESTAGATTVQDGSILYPVNSTKELRWLRQLAAVREYKKTTKTE